MDNYLVENKRRYILLRGKIKDLKIITNKYEFDSALSNKSGKITALGAGILGISSVASALQNSYSGISVEYFECSIDNNLIVGFFNSVDFNINDEVEIVAEQQEDNTYYAYTVRRPRDNVMWMHVYCGRGRKAYERYNRKEVLRTFFIDSAIIALVAFYIIINTSILFGLFVLFLMTIVVTLPMCWFFYRRYQKYESRFCHLSEKVFDILGYDDPSCVDMYEEDKKYRKEGYPLGKEYYGGWVFRYITAPIIRDSL